MKKLIVSLLSLGVIFFFGAYKAYADMHKGMGGMGDGMHEGCMMEGMKHRGMEHRIWERLKDLNLDDNQKEAIKEIKSRTEKESVKKMADLKVARIELRDILHKDPVDVNAAETKLKQLESMKTDLHLSHIKALEEIKSKLTPEQRKKFVASFGKNKKWKHGSKGLHKHEEKEG